MLVGLYVVTLVLRRKQDRYMREEGRHEQASMDFECRQPAAQIPVVAGPLRGFLFVVFCLNVCGCAESQPDA